MSAENSKMNPITLESKIGELYKSPVGHDTLYKVLMQLGLSEKMILNPIVSNLKLKTIAGLTKRWKIIVYRCFKF